MARYNAGNTYNDQYNSFYNSSPRLVIILDDGHGADSILGLNCQIPVSESGIGAETIALKRNHSHG